MSGHSKWANIKHRKARQDAKKGVAFQKLVKNIISAAKAGGGDPNSNFRLKIAIERARAGNVPVDNIERGIKRGTGELGGTMEEIVYEGYGPNGVAVMVQAMTDNRNRTAPEMRSLFTKCGGAIGELGCVAWNFDRKGVIEIVGEGIDEDELLMAAIDAGADDMGAGEDGGFEITCDPSLLSVVAEALKNAGYNVDSMEFDMVPKNSIAINNKSDAEKLLAMVERFEDNDDVQAVYANFDIPEDILAEIDE